MGEQNCEVDERWRVWWCDAALPGHAVVGSLPRQRDETGCHAARDLSASVITAHEGVWWKGRWNHVHDHSSRPPQITQLGGRERKGEGEAERGWGSDTEGRVPYSSTCTQTLPFYLPQFVTTQCSIGVWWTLYTPSVHMDKQLFKHSSQISWKQNKCGKVCLVVLPVRKHRQSEAVTHILLTPSSFTTHLQNKFATCALSAYLSLCRRRWLPWSLMCLFSLKSISTTSHDTVNNNLLFSAHPVKATMAGMFWTH